MYQRRNPATGKREGNFYISVGGVRRSAETDDRAKAKALEHRLNAEAWDQRHGLVVPTWERACLTWMDDNPRVSGSYESGKQLEFWKNKLTGKKLDAITPKLLHSIIAENFKVNLLEPVGPNSTANGYVAFVARVIRHSSNLNPKFTYYPRPKGRDRWLTVPEWFLFSGKASPDFEDLCTFSLVTLAREANVMGLCWSWLKDSDTWVMIPPEFTKTARVYTFPLCRTAQAVIKRRREHPVRHPELVFLNNGRPWYPMAISRLMKATTKSAAIDPLVFHGFRHTGASWLAQRGVSHSIRARLGCWATGSMTDHYSHFDVESLRPFAEIFDSIINEGRAAFDSQQKASA